VAVESTASGAVSMFSVVIVSTAPLNKKGTHTVSSLEPAKRPREMPTLQGYSKYIFKEQFTSIIARLTVS